MQRFFNKWHPKTLAGQLFGLFLLALILAHVVVVIFVANVRPTETIHPLSLGDLKLKVASVYQAVNASDFDTASKLASNLSLPESKFAILKDFPAFAAEMNTEEGEIAQSIRQRLQLDPHLKIAVFLHSKEEGAAGVEQALNPLDDGTPKSPWMLDLYVQMPSGLVLHNVSYPWMLTAHWARVLSFSIPVGLLPIVFIALFFGRFIMQPLRNLANAVKRLSAGEPVVQVPVTGPQDMRDLIETFNTMQLRIASNAKEQANMIASIGHDLRTPLTSLRIRLELLEDSTLREKMIATVDEMSEMSDEILYFSKNNALLENKANVNLSTLIQDLVEERKTLGDKITSNIQSDLFYECKPVHLKRAISNLIDNAARFGSVFVNLYLDEKNKIVIEVSDDGPGIPEDQIDKIFTPFFQLDKSRTKEIGKGVGLGLSIVKSCVDSHGGKIDVFNRKEGGVCAKMTL